MSKLMSLEGRSSSQTLEDHSNGEDVSRWMFGAIQTCLINKSNWLLQPCSRLKIFASLIAFETWLALTANIKPFKITATNEIKISD
jgi:hypothetical protein